MSATQQDSPATTRLTSEVEAIMECMRKKLFLRGTSVGDADSAVAALHGHGKATLHDVARLTEAEMVEATERAEYLGKVGDQHNLMSVWSAGSADDFYAPHPFSAAKILSHVTIAGQGVWGGKGGRLDAPILGNRWLDIWIAADSVIQHSGDLPHRSVKRFVAGANPAELYLISGGCGGREHGE